MAEITLQLTAQSEQLLRSQATRQGQTLEEYLCNLAEKEARAGAADMLEQGLQWLTQRSPADIQLARERILTGPPPRYPSPAGKGVLDVVEGKWPSAESDAEIREALDRIS